MDALQALLAADSRTSGLKIYPRSIRKTEDVTVFMAAGEAEDWLIADGDAGFCGETFWACGKTCCKAPLSHQNAFVLRALFPFTAPVPVLGNARTMGVGDRLGIATPGHIRVFEKYDVYPVFAQQSIRELNLTNRTYEDVLDCASFAVFREGYTRGFGADGDHLKTPEEIQCALSCGYSMITLDCSEYIRNDITVLSDQVVNVLYTSNPVREARYLGRGFYVEGYRLEFSPMAFKRMCLIYGAAIDFAAEMYQRFFAVSHPCDFEISIDETATPTDPAQHFFIASELTARGVKAASIAPRFCGEFQKGIDYIGDIAQFEQEFAVHAAIARHFGYKISVHSGSDKFTVFPAVGKYTQGRFHVKTAGTSWLMAMQIIAVHEPALYREIHAYALDTAFAEARKYYHVTTDLDRISPLASLEDDQLPALFQQDDVRQLIHITYGQILGAANPDGSSRFRDRLYRAWRKHAEEYAAQLDTHLSRHLDALNCDFLK